MSQASFDLDDLGEPTYSVRELADAVNQVLRRGFFDGVWVRGEIEGLQVRGGHLYCSLGERDATARATIPVAIFAGTLARLRPLLDRHRLRLRDGLSVRIHGRLDLYAPTGRLTLVVDGLDPTFTLGQMAVDRDQLLRRLVAEDLLDRNRRLAVPVLAVRVGLVTSKASAAFHDFVHELERSRLPFHVTLVDVRVQGANAPGEVAAAIATLGRRPVDVVVVVRGGGARSDLAAFDSEVIARAIARCPVPVLTGLGHEIDRSVADEVAHTALKTPTACANELVERVRGARQRAEQGWSGVARRAGRLLDGADAATRGMKRRLDLASQEVPIATGHRLERAASRLADRAHRCVDGARIEDAAARLARRAPRVAQVASRDLDGIEARVRGLDPARVLARGWSISRTVDGRVVRRADELHPGDVLLTTFADGSARSRVTEIDP